MRIKTERIEYLANLIVTDLLEEGFIIYPGGDVSDLIALVSTSIVEELQIEDKVDEEVKKIMESHENELDNSNANYNRVFNMIKHKLVRDRGIVL